MSGFCACFGLDQLSYEYFPEPYKCFVVVVPSFCSIASDIFGHSSMQIVTGNRFLDGFIGHSDDRQKFVMQKILQWSTHVRTLTSIALVRSQATYANYCNLNGCFLLESFLNVDPYLLIWRIHSHLVFCNLYLLSLLLRDNCFAYLYSFVAWVL